MDNEEVKTLDMPVLPGGAFHDTPDGRDFRAGALLPGSDGFPRVAHFDTIVTAGDQGALGSCVGWAVAAMLRHLIVKRTMKRFPGGTMLPNPLSALAAWYNARKIDGTEFVPTGTMPRSALAAAQHLGVPPEWCWPYDKYDTWKATTRPKLSARFAGLFQKGFRYYALDTLSDMRQAIVDGYGFIAILPITQGMYQTRYTGGEIPPTYPNEPFNGYHCVWITGYDDDTERFTFLNSWGTEYGGNGFGTIPYSFYPDNLTDLWTIRPL